MMIVAKMDGRIVQIIRVAHAVSFSEERDWVMVCFDFDQIDQRKQQFKWVPAATRFEWVREYSF
jgi:phosphotransferase system IIA component